MGKAHATGFYSPATFFCRRSDSRIRHFQQRFFGNDRRVKCFVGYKYPTYIWIPACEGMTAEISTKIASPVFRRLFASSVYIVTWALPTTMTAKRGRLKFWVWFVGKAHATGFRRLTLFDFVFTHLKTHFHAASCG